MPSGAVMENGLRARLGVLSKGWNLTWAWDDRNGSDTTGGALSVVRHDATQACDLLVSVVVFEPDRHQLQRTLQTLGESVRRAGLSALLVIVDNTPAGTPWLEEVLPVSRIDQPRIMSGHGNVGFGRGHNMTIGLVRASYHLVLNPDVEFEPLALRNAMAFMGNQPDCALVVPEVVSPAGEREHLCRRYPSVLVLALRGFAPGWVSRRFTRLLAAYEMRDAPDGILWDPPVAGGCCMLFRADVLQALTGFDERFFLYFEDFDLSIRTRRLGRVARVPSVRILHHGGGAARKGHVHVRAFVRSAFAFFSLHGWRWV